MLVQIYIILEPGADRPYFSHTPPTNYQKKNGAKTYLVEANIPEWAHVDGHIMAMGKLFESKTNANDS
jgi:hypothetical protein